MPEYLAPGVFVEEVSYRAKSIEGVSTTTTGFVGPTRYGPTDVEPEIITSLVEFEQVYGGRNPLELSLGGVGQRVDNYIWSAVRAFFEEGGKRLYVSRVFKQDNALGDGHARVTNPAPGANIAIKARYPGKAGEGRVRLQFSAGPNRYTNETNSSGVAMARVRGARHRDIVHVTDPTAVKTGFWMLLYDETNNKWTLSNGTAAQDFDMQVLQAIAGEVLVRTITVAVYVDPTSAELPAFAISGLPLDPFHQSDGAEDSIFAYFGKDVSASLARRIPITISALDLSAANASHAASVSDFQAKTGAATAANNAKNTADGKAVADEALALTARTDANNNLGDAAKQQDAVDAEAVAKASRDIAITKAKEKVAADAAKESAKLVRDAAKSIVDALNAGNSIDGLSFLKTYATGPGGQPNTFDPAEILASIPKPNAGQVNFILSDGNDGTFSGQSEYEGEINDPMSTRSTGLKAFESVEDISIVAAPGSSFAPPGMANADVRAQSIANTLITHCRRMAYRIAIIDSVYGHSISEVRNYRGKFDSSHAAFYYPWVRIVDPNTGQENHYPPSGFVAGIYARNDIERAVYKAPANEVVNLAIGFERLLSKSHQEVLNPEGINCFRFFEGRGMRLWGARTMSSDPEWKYVNLRRYFAFLERSIDKGTQWAVFEPNGERLWAKVRQTIEDFLLNEWQNGALLGERKEKAYFVKCDRSTMTQNDLDNGRLVCQIGIAALRPAEFVIFRIGQWTADAKS